jgi:aspartyl-tRNA(Asn)/glutamyl-tRNA(Gln) amidotransferase subunit C
MIDRTQVLHVARLARLQLTDEEVERMSTELSSILGHIETISELDLAGVPPTAHVSKGAGALRRDDPRPSLDRDAAFAGAPDIADEGFRVPSPQAGS